MSARASTRRTLAASRRSTCLDREV
jgi:hypothetical protein